MKQIHLKRFRVILALLFFTFTTVLFLDVSNSIQQYLSDKVLFLQFLPSLVGFIGAVGITSIGFLIIILITVLWGRIYCSSVCPLGVFQDIMLYLKRKITKKKFRRQQFQFTKPLTKIRFLFFILAFALLPFSILIGINLLDPYSNFGRIFSNIFRPILIGINNSAVFVLEKFNYYSIFPVEFKGLDIFSFLFAFSILSLVLYLTLTRERLYCNSVCPVGTLLGYISKLSIFKIKINESACKDCGICEKVCKANCIDLESKFVDETRCVSCFNCLQVCPSAGITYQSSFKKSKTRNVNEQKRDFLKNISIFFLGSNLLLKAQEKIKVYKESTIPVIRNYGVTPPGSISIDNFTDNCTACHLCISSCPTQVLQPSFLEYGLLGIMQPTMNYKKGFCNYDCIICGEVCPTDAITPQIMETKKLIQLGKAKFVKDNCIVYSQGTDCGACAEHCPTKAVKMTLDPEVNRKAPKINEEICIGCGACEYACPTKPYKSIYIDSNPVHQIAKKPKEENQIEEVDFKEEFPF